MPMDKAFAIFDMDGTLVDSMAYWNNLCVEYLTGRGVTEGLEGIRARTESMKMLDAAAFFLEHFSLSGTPEEAAAEMSALMEGHYRHDVPAKPGAAAYLSGLKARGVKMCIASATAVPLAEMCLRRLGLLDFFDFLLSCESMGVSKQKPDIYLTAAARLGGAPADTAVYEDALYAAKTAKAAGFHLVGVYDVNAAGHWPELAGISDEILLQY